MSVPHRIVFVQHNFPMFPITFTQNGYYIYINLYKYIIIESSPAASLTGLIGHELQCLQRNVWDRRFSAERYVELRLPICLIVVLLKWMYATYRQYKNSCCCFFFRKMCSLFRCMFDIISFLYITLCGPLIALFYLPQNDGPVHRRSAPSLYEMQWSPGASGRLDNTWSPSFC